MEQNIRITCQDTSMEAREALKQAFCMINEKFPNSYAKYDTVIGQKNNIITEIIVPAIALGVSANVIYDIIKFAAKRIWSNAKNKKTIRLIIHSVDEGDIVVEINE